MSTPPVTEGQQRNVEFVRRFLNFLNDGGLTAIDHQIDSFIHPEIEWTPGLMALGKKTYRGRDEYRRYVKEADQRVSNQGFLNIDEIRPIDEDGVLALCWIHLVSAEGESLDNDYALLVRFEDGLIRSLQSFLSRDEAERAAGA